MCYNGKCMYCLDVDTGALIFSVLSVIFTGMGTLFVIGVLVYINVLMATANEAILMGQTFGSLFVANLVFLIILCAILPGFAFSIVLIKGIIKKEPGHVKAYFVYGVTKLVLFFIATVFCMIDDGINGIFALIICAIYGLILLMIQMTYKKFSSGEVLQYRHNKLIDDMSLELPRHMVH